ncbi:FHA domain-containing protein [Pseudomonas putida]
MSTLTLCITNLDQLLHTVTARHQFDCAGGTIGSEGATWLINDREQTVAPIHCEIRWVEGSFCVIDRCNRTYLNDSIISLGALPARRLLEGDRLRIGAYRLQAQCSPATAGSLEDLFNPDQRVLDQLIAEVTAEVCRSRSPATLAVAEICSVFEPGLGNDPLAALDAVTVTGPAQACPLQRLIAGEQP